MGIQSAPVADEPKQSESSVSDETLLARYRDGDLDAFSTLVRRYQRKLYVFLERFLLDAALAEDVFQETFLKVHLAVEQFDFSRRFAPWLFRIASNKARDALRARKRRPEMSLDAPADGGKGPAKSFGELMPSRVPAPPEEMMNLQTRRDVEEMVRQMPLDLREALVLGYFCRWPYRDIAETLDLPLGTVKSRLHAAVAHFARQWKARQE